MLDKQVIAYLDEVASNVCQSNAIKNFPYQSFDEILHLTTVSLLRELMQNSNGNFSFKFLRYSKIFLLVNITKQNLTEDNLKESYKLLLVLF